MLRSSIDTLIHELYHAVQVGEGMINFKVDWIREGTAAAVASNYSQLRTHQSYLADMKFDETLVLNTDDKEYDRGYFFLKAGDVLDGHDSIGYLAKLFGYKEDVGGAHGLNWLDSFLRKKGSTLHQVYNEVVAEYAAQDSDYNSLKEEIEVTAIEQPVIKESKVTAWASHARRVWFDSGSLKVPDHTDETGFLPLATVDIPDGQGPDHARLIASKRLAKDKRVDFLIDPERVSAVGFRFLTRVTNMPRIKPSDGQDEEIAVRARTSIVEFTKPSCVSHGESWQIDAAIIPDDYQLRYSAKHGAVSTEGLYTAPAAGELDELFVEAYGTKGKAPTSLGKIKLSKNGCPFQLISSDGYSFIYDPDSEMALAKGPSGPEKAYFDRDHIYGYDPSTGWVKMNKSMMTRFGAQMSKETGGLTDMGPELRKLAKGCKGFDTTGPDPFTWGRAPFDFLADLEYNRLAPLAKSCGKAIKISEPEFCPVTAPSCHVITIAGRDKVIYNGGKQIIEIQLGDGTTHQVRRVNTRISAPKGARLIKF